MLLHFSLALFEQIHEQRFRAVNVNFSGSEAFKLLFTKLFSNLKFHPKFSYLSIYTKIF